MPAHNTQRTAVAIYPFDRKYQFIINDRCFSLFYLLVTIKYNYVCPFQSVTEGDPDLCTRLSLEISSLLPLPQLKNFLHVLSCRPFTVKYPIPSSKTVLHVCRGCNPSFINQIRVGRFGFIPRHHFFHSSLLEEATSSQAHHTLSNSQHPLELG